MFCNIFIATKMNRTHSPLVFMATDSSRTYIFVAIKMNPISRSMLRRKLFLFPCLSGHKENKRCT